MTTDISTSAEGQTTVAADSSQVPVVLEKPVDETSLAALAAKLPLQLDLRVPVPSFRVQSLLSLEKGQIVETIWPHTEDLPLWAGDVQLVWTEFEVVDQKLGVRVTRLA